MNHFQVRSAKSVKSIKSMNSLGNQSPYVQIAVSASGGFVTGFVFFRVSKLLAICVGGAILTIEVAVQSGLITIDWNKVFSQQEESRYQVQATNTLSMARTPFRSTDRTAELEMIEKAKNLILSSARLSVAFLGGFLLGFGFA